MEKLRLKEKMKGEKAKSVKENAIRQATVWSADSSEGFKDFMNDEDSTKEKAILKPHKGEASNLIYQVIYIW
jgi:NAD(P)H-hydrate repair Nnr-like enzyme with NAD(P)H-hydrate dehydratase domain